MRVTMNGRWLVEKAGNYLNRQLVGKVERQADDRDEHEAYDSQYRNLQSGKYRKLSIILKILIFLRVN